MDLEKSSRNSAIQKPDSLKVKVEPDDTYSTSNGVGCELYEQYIGIEPEDLNLTAVKVEKQDPIEPDPLEFLDTVEIKEGEYVRGRLDSSEETILQEEKAEEERTVDKHQNTSIETQVTIGTHDERTPNSHEDERTPNSSSVNQKGRKRRLDELTEAVKELRCVYQALAHDDSFVNENEAFGKFIALSLQKMPVNKAILAQKEIQAVLTRYRLAALPKISKSKQSC